MVPHDRHYKSLEISNTAAGGALARVCKASVLHLEIILFIIREKEDFGV
jgi:hypothetical protein